MNYYRNEMKRNETKRNDSISDRMLLNKCMFIQTSKRTKQNLSQ